MGDIAATFETYVPLKALGGGKLMAHMGYATGAGATNELATKLADIICAIITPEDYAETEASGGQVYSCDRVISDTGKVTVARKADAGSEVFQFLLIGRVT
ncbi:unnamed protein product [marine sediment metagenome]|uniref:Uncharacterized protein n=1 Tax=marine sediment metagenome TaxID=412755 RepID=X1R227_9ZZZZ